MTYCRTCQYQLVRRPRRIHGKSSKPNVSQNCKYIRWLLSQSLCCMGYCVVVLFLMHPFNPIYKINGITLGTSFTGILTQIVYTPNACYKLQGTGKPQIKMIAQCYLSRNQLIKAQGRVTHIERSEFSSNFEFDRNMLSGTGAWSVQSNFLNNAGILLIRSLKNKCKCNRNRNSYINTKMHLKMLHEKWWLFCLGLNVF